MVLDMWEIFERLMHEKGVTMYAVARNTGIAPSTLTDWRAGRYKPKADKMRRIADYFDVPVEYLLTGEMPPKESDSGQKWYFSDKTAETAQELFENKELRVLFDAARDARPEDLRLAADLLMRLKGTNPDG